MEPTVASEPTGKRYLVTGCAGMIGSQLCADLLNAGNEVVGLDNLVAGYDQRLKQWRLEQLQTNALFTFVAGDVCQPEQVATIFAKRQLKGKTAISQVPFAAVFNLAARAGVRASATAPADYIQTNLVGTMNLLDACRQYDVKKFVLASSSSVYGASTASPFREDAPCDQPLSPYAASKRAAEMLAYTYHHLHGIDVSVLRYFTVYGPAGRPDMSIFRFVRQAIEEEPIHVFGDGSQCRDFTYVDDISRGTIAAECPLSYEIINLGGQYQASIREVLQILQEETGRELEVFFGADHPADVPMTCADVSKAHRLLGWEPNVSLREGIARCVRWYREYRDFARSIALDG